MPPSADSNLAAESAGAAARARVVRPAGIVRNAVYNTAAVVLNLLAALVLTPVLTRALTKEAFGAWTTLGYVQQIMRQLTFGLDTASETFVAREVARQDWDAAGRIMATIRAVLLASGVLILVPAGLWTSWKVDELVPDLPPHLVVVTSWGLVILTISLVLSAVLSASAWFMNALQRYDVRAIYSVAGQFLFVFVSIVLLWLGADLAGMIATQAIFHLILPSLLAWIWLRRNVPWLDYRLSRSSARIAWKATAFGFSTMVFITGYYLASNGIGLILGNAYGARVSADYGLTLKLYSVATGLLINASHVLRPVITTLSVQGDQARIREGYRRTLTIISGLAILEAVGLGITARPLMLVYGGQEYETAAVMVLALLPTLISSAPRFVTFDIMVGLGRHHFFVVTSIVGTAAALGVGALGVWLGLSPATVVLLSALADIPVSVVATIWYGGLVTGCPWVRLLIGALVRPAAALAPLIAIGYALQGLYPAVGNIGGLLIGGAVAVILGPTLLLAFGLSRADAKVLLRLIRR